MIKKIKIGPYGSILEPIDFNLGSLTLIRGANCSGKSMICHGISLGMMSRRRSLPPYWCRGDESSAAFECWIEDKGNMSKHLLRRFRVNEDREGIYSYTKSEWFLNGQRRADAGSLEEIIHPIYLSYGMDPDSGSLGDITESRFFEIGAAILGYHEADSGAGKQAVSAILQELNGREGRLFKHVTLHQGRILVHEWENDYSVVFGKTGSSNINALLVDFALHVAETYAETKHTLLMLDGHPNMFYKGESHPLYERFMDRIHSALSDRLQVLMTTVNPEDYHDIIHPDATINLASYEGIKGTEIASVEYATTSTVNLADTTAVKTAKGADREDFSKPSHTSELPTVGTDSLPENFFWKRGNVWEARFAGGSAILIKKFVRGCEFLQYLVARPTQRAPVYEVSAKVSCESFHNLEAAKVDASEIDSGFEVTQGLKRGDLGDVADDSAIRDYANKLRELADEARELRESNRADEAEALHEDIAQVEKAYNEARGRSGRKRKSKDEKKNLRDAVRNNINRTISEISLYDKAFGDHLEKSIDKGAVLGYHPEPLINWSIRPKDAPHRKKS